MAPIARVPAALPPSSLSVFREDIFKGKVLFCTGGGSGICREMTEAILRHGANATIVGRNVERLTNAAKGLSEATGQTVIYAQADVREPKLLQDAVAKTIEKFGRIDFVICGAAGNFLAPIEGLSENAFKSVISIDVLGTYNTVKATLPYVRESRGSYIHVSATLHYQGSPLQAHVSAAKAGIDALSNVIAVEEGPRGVRSNVIAPGAIAGTEGMDRLAPPGATDMSSKISLQRMGEKADIANAAVFLFSEAANYITGQAIAVDGGEIHSRAVYHPYPDAVLGGFQSKL
ncbi:hypothetical protein M422DRAFT_189142 [Sphaerobolus stellatus SS14]|uniref:2,4-dienoyl-CoA reductase [(3E)-enoyl-CoA-producing] n=1 Tax=Sphaerobolus stellatus (strain SS14) TaxID=990650 RepID=A0A0C9THH5_SPHS4|nr:hypothetical protein M422DRAFT_785390 [Sphaerobolus stellatus SS14]KIJ28908.1 hypothetical protein M422DRAFT_189142 [Sphaerobolus stellatus SS14]